MRAQNLVTASVLVKQRHGIGCCDSSVWVGDGDLATVADACLTISLKQVACTKLKTSAVPKARKPRVLGWRRWLPCQLIEAEEPDVAQAEQLMPLQVLPA